MNSFISNTKSSSMAETWIRFITPPSLRSLISVSLMASLCYQSPSKPISYFQLKSNPSPPLISKVSVKTFAPATVANLGPGFDFLGCAVDGLGDHVTLRVDPSVRAGDFSGEAGHILRRHLSSLILRGTRSPTPLASSQEKPVTGAAPPNSSSADEFPGDSVHLLMGQNTLGPSAAVCTTLLGLLLRPTAFQQFRQTLGLH